MKAIKKYTGGIHFLIQAAIAEDGRLFTRTQDKTRWGYSWGKWKEKGKLDVNNLPGTIPAGFSTLYPTSKYNDFGARLPND